MSEHTRVEQQSKIAKVVQDFEKNYDGKNYEYVKFNSAEDVAIMKKQFFKKYPNAHMSRFEFYANFDKNRSFIDPKIYF